MGVSALAVGNACEEKEAQSKSVDGEVLRSACEFPLSRREFEEGNVEPYSLPFRQRCAVDNDVAEFEKNMNIEKLHIGMKVRHPQYGVGVVKSLSEKTAEIAFDDAPRTIAPASSDLQPAEPTATLSQLEMPLANLIRDTAHAMVEALGLEQKDVLVEGLAARWQKGTLFMQPADTSLQPKEVPLETFFHKIVMIRNNLRVLEQKVNASDKLSEADKFDLQQYITRCYGSLTTFNILFKNKEDQFRTGA